MFLSGLGASAAAPQIVLFLVKELGTPLPIAGLYYLTNLTAPIAGYLVGNHSDRTGERLILFRLCALAGFAGWAAIALSTKVWMPFLISSLVLAFSVAASSQLFAAVRDDLDQEAQGSSSRPPQNLLHPGGICFPCRTRPRGYGEIRSAEIEARRRQYVMTTPSPLYV